MPGKSSEMYEQLNKLQQQQQQHYRCQRQPRCAEEIFCVKLLQQLPHVAGGLEAKQIGDALKALIKSMYAAGKTIAVQEEKYELFTQVSKMYGTICY